MAYWMEVYDNNGEIACFDLLIDGAARAVAYPVEIGGGREGVSCIVFGEEFLGEGLEDIQEKVEQKVLTR